jgi:hypothetical protein
VRTFIASFGHRLGCIDFEVRARSERGAIIVAKALLSAHVTRPAEWSLNGVVERD